MKLFWYVIALAIGSSLLIQLFQLFLPSDGINWPISMGWASMLVPPLVMSAITGFKRHDWKPFIAISGCVWVYWSDYFLHGPQGYDLLASTGLQLSLLLWCIICEQKTMAKLGVLNLAFGVLFYAMAGRFINTGDHGIWRLAWSFITIAMTLPPVYVFLKGPTNGIEASRESGEPQAIQENFKRAG